MAKGAGLLFAFLPSAAVGGAPLRRHHGLRHRPTAFVSRGCGGDNDVDRASRGRLHGRRKDRKGGSGGKRRGQKNTKNAPSSSTSPSVENIAELSSSATRRPPATLAGVVEDHRHEQFFYDDATSHQLYQLVDLYDRPLLLCNPTLAVMAERRGKEYRLLDRDARFNFLGGYERFSLTEPHLVSGYDFDAVFVDPPFANVTPDQVARCLRLMGAEGVPLWVAYNSRREDRLLEAMNALECPNLEKKWRLTYKEGVSEDTQDSIWLYGPGRSEEK